MESRGKNLTETELEIYYDLIAMYGEDKAAMRHVNTALLEKYELKDTPENRKSIKSKYERAHPRYPKLQKKRRDMYLRALEQKYRQHLLGQSQRDVRRSLLLQSFFDKTDPVVFFQKITTLEGLEYVTAVCKLNDSIASARADTASLIALYDNLLYNERIRDDNGDGTEKRKA